MKITHAQTHVLRTPASNPLVVGLPAPTDTREFVTVELGTDQGLTGLGLTFFGGALTPALKSAVDTLAGLTIGEDPTQTELIAAKCRRAASHAGPGGIYSLALSAIDIACWDLKGKAVGQSVCALLGGLRDRAPTYASGALMRPHPKKYLAEAGPRLVKMGFRQMKMQCGSEATVAESIERVRVMRESIGPDVDLMCDINQLWSVNQAIEIGTASSRTSSSGWRTPSPTTITRAWPGSLTPSHADRRRRVRLRHRAVPPLAGAPLDRHRDDRPAASGRHHPVDEDRGHGGGLQPARWSVTSSPSSTCTSSPPFPTGLRSSTCRGRSSCSRKRPPMDAGQLVVPRKPGFGLSFDAGRDQALQGRLRPTQRRRNPWPPRTRSRSSRARAAASARPPRWRS